jgi:hypothetical protein
MGQPHDPLIVQIERDALDGKASLASALRKCVTLGGKSRSEELRDWAMRELKGYPRIDELPEYRIIAAPLRLDGFSGNYKITGEELPPMALPDFAREHISNELPLTQGVGELENLAKQPEIRLAPPGASDLALYMNTQGNTGPYGHINSIYWQVSPSAINGVLDQIRTSLTQLVAELRATMPADEAIPSADEANQAVNVVVSGKRSKVQVTTAQTSGEGARADARAEESADEPGFWTLWRKIGAFAVGVATIAGTAFAAIEVL